MLLASIGQFKDQATNRLLIAALEECEDSGTTQKDSKTPVKCYLQLNIAYVQPRVHNNKSVQLPYGFYTHHLDGDDVGHQQ